MADSAELLFYDLDCSPVPLSTDDVGHLLEMFRSPGWKVFLRMKLADAQEAVWAGMDLAADDEKTRQHKALFHGLLADIAMETTMKDELAQKQAVALAEISETRLETPNPGLFAKLT